MITWMQKHKKYLVITIWISTIAFVGAGFVGWGAYDFNRSRATSVAKVGSIDVSMQKFQNSYLKLIDYYSQMTGRNITQEEADRFGLSQIVMQQLVQEALFLNYAQELGLSISDEELINELIKTPEFQVNGVFDKKQYENSLRLVRMTPTNYENQLKDSLLLEKLLNNIALNSDEVGVEILAADMFMQDKIKAKFITTNIKNPTQDELKKSWEDTKDLYLTPLKYEFDSYFVKTNDKDLQNEDLQKFYEENKLDYRDDNGKILDFTAAKSMVTKDLAMKNAKKSALEKYIKLKKGDDSFQEVFMLSSDDTKGIDIAMFKNTNIDEVLKPIEYNDGFIILKVKNIINPEPKSFEDAKNDVQTALINKLRKEKLENLAQAALENKKNFTKVVTFARDYDGDILGLNQEQSSLLIQKVFSSDKKDGYIVFNDKAVAYEIIEQNLLDKNKLATFKLLLNTNAASLKNTQIKNALLGTLAKKYKTQVYYK